MENVGKFLGDEVFDDPGLSGELSWLPLLHWYCELLLKFGQGLGHHGNPNQVLDLGGLDLVLLLGGLGGVLLYGVQVGNVGVI